MLSWLYKHQSIETSQLCCENHLWFPLIGGVTSSANMYFGHMVQFIKSPPLWYTQNSYIRSLQIWITLTNITGIMVNLSLKMNMHTWSLLTLSPMLKTWSVVTIDIWRRRRNGENCCVSLLNCKYLPYYQQMKTHLILAFPTFLCIEQSWFDADWYWCWSFIHIYCFILSECRSVSTLDKGMCPRVREAGRLVRVKVIDVWVVGIITWVGVPSRKGILFFIQIGYLILIRFYIRERRTHF